MPASASSKSTSTPQAVVREDERIAREIAQGQIKAKQLEDDDRKLALRLQQEESSSQLAAAGASLPSTGAPTITPAAPLHYAPHSTITQYPPPTAAGIYAPPMSPPLPAIPIPPEQHQSTLLPVPMIPAPTPGPPTIVPIGTYLPPNAVAAPGTYALPGSGNYPAPAGPPPSGLPMASGEYAPPPGPPPSDLGADHTVYAPPPGPPPSERPPSSPLAELAGLSFTSPTLPATSATLQPPTAVSPPGGAQFNPFRSTSPQLTVPGLSHTNATGALNPFRSTSPTSARSPSPSAAVAAAFSGNPFLDPIPTASGSNPFQTLAPAAAPGSSRTIDPFASGAFFSVSSTPLSTSPSALDYSPLASGQQPQPSVSFQIPQSSSPLPPPNLEEEMLSMDLAARIALEEKGDLLGYSRDALRRQDEEQQNLAEAARIALITAEEAEDEMLTKRLQEIEDEELAKRLAEEDGSDGLVGAASSSALIGNDVGFLEEDDAEVARRMQQEMEDEDVARRIADEENSRGSPQRALSVSTVPTYAPPPGPPLASRANSTSSFGGTRLIQPLSSQSRPITRGLRNIPTVQGLTNRFFSSTNQALAPSTSNSSSSFGTSYAAPTSSASSITQRGGSRTSRTPAAANFTPAPSSAGLPSGAIVVPAGASIPEGYVFAGVAGNPNDPTPPPPYAI
ncbi:hypothetical protein HDU67_005939 [Dinochytrium kinnereticum]|nr:hypothetical protein HDU67_005939 [Dinochytrium kinnereticum]